MWTRGESPGRQRGRPLGGLLVEGETMEKLGAEKLGELCEQVADVIEADPLGAARAARRLAVAMDPMGVARRLALRSGSASK